MVRHFLQPQLLPNPSQGAGGGGGGRLDRPVASSGTTIARRFNGRWLC